MPIIRKQYKREVLKALIHTTWTLYCSVHPAATPYLKSVQNIMTNPIVGDLVIETTTMHRKIQQAEGDFVIGRVVEISDEPNNGMVYVIDRLNGKRERWSNASFIVILEKALHDYEGRK